MDNLIKINGSRATKNLSLLIPNMTSNTSDVGAVSVSNYSSSNYGWYAFNGYTYFSNAWEISYTKPATTNDYIMFTFNETKTIYSWVCICLKNVGGTYNANVIAVLDDGSEIVIGTLDNIPESPSQVVGGGKTVQNVRAVKIQPTSFTAYNQIRVQYFNVIGEW